jgi:hypothetical protein
MHYEPLKWIRVRFEVNAILPQGWSYFRTQYYQQHNILYDSRALIIRISMRISNVRGACILCLKHFWGYVISKAGNLTGEKSCVFYELSRMKLLRIPIHILHNLTLTSAKWAPNLFLEVMLLLLMTYIKRCSGRSTGDMRDTIYASNSGYSSPSALKSSLNGGPFPSASFPHWLGCPNCLPYNLFARTE